MRHFWPFLLFAIACGRWGVEPLLVLGDGGDLDAAVGRGSKQPIDFVDAAMASEDAQDGQSPGAGGATPGSAGAPGAGGATPGSAGAPGAGGATPGSAGAPGVGGGTPGSAGTSGTGGATQGSAGAPGTGGTTPGNGGQGIGGSTSGIPQPSAAVAPFYGVWKGTARNGNITYPIEISVADRSTGQKLGLFHVPTYDCGGYTTLQNLGASLVYKETLVFDLQGNCGPAGTTTLTPLAAKSLTYSFFDGKKTDRGSTALVSDPGVVIPPTWLGLWSSDVASAKPSVLLVLVSGQVGSIAGHILYPNKSCGGTLTVKKTNAGTVDFSEKLSHATVSCTDGNTVSISAGGNGLHFHWVAPSGGATGDATLSAYK